MDKFDFLGAAHSSMIEDMYHKFCENPNLVEEDWKEFFKGYDFAKELYTEEDINPIFKKEFKVLNLIEGYRKRGHLFTKTNPVRDRRKYTPTLDFVNFDLEESDLNTVFRAGEEVGIGSAKLKDIIAHLEKVYCQLKCH